MPDLVRPPDEKDPEDVGETYRKVAGEMPTSGADAVALREMWYHLRVQREADPQNLVDVAYREASSLTGAYETREEWWNVIGSTYFRLLPHVVTDDGRQWRFEDGEDVDEPPEAPEEYEAPTEARVAEVLEEFEPPRGHPMGHESRSNVRAIYEHVRETGEATAAELKEVFEPAPEPNAPTRTVAAGGKVLEANPQGSGDRPETDQWREAENWFREIGRPALAHLPGVEPPRLAGRPFVFVGVPPEEAKAIGNRPDPEGLLEDRLAAADVGGRGEWRSQRRKALRAAYAELEENGSVTRADLVHRIDADRLGYSSAEAFVDERAGDVLARLPGVSREDGDTWRFDDEKAYQEAVDVAS